MFIYVLFIVSFDPVSGSVLGQVNLEKPVFETLEECQTALKTLPLPKLPEGLVYRGYCHSPKEDTDLF